MSDPVDILSLASHGGTALVGAGGVGAFMRWVSGKEAEAVSTRLALMEQKLDQLVTSAGKHETTGERVALVEQRLDALVATPPRRRK